MKTMLLLLLSLNVLSSAQASEFKLKEVLDKTIAEAITQKAVNIINSKISFIRQDSNKHGPITKSEQELICSEEWQTLDDDLIAKKKFRDMAILEYKKNPQSEELWSSVQNLSPNTELTANMDPNDKIAKLEEGIKNIALRRTIALSPTLIDEKLTLTGTDEKELTQSWDRYATNPQTLDLTAKEICALFIAHLNQTTSKMAQNKASQKEMELLKVEQPKTTTKPTINNYDPSLKRQNTQTIEADDNLAAPNVSNQ